MPLVDKFCAWCGEFMGKVQSDTGALIHGLCDKCIAWHAAQRAAADKLKAAAISATKEVLASTPEPKTPAESA